jgi:hypothetical protein
MRGKDNRSAPIHLGAAVGAAAVAEPAHFETRDGMIEMRVW